MDSFRFFLIAYQVICMMTDFNFHFLMQPIPLFPIVAGYCVGVLATVFNIYFHYLIVIHTTWQAMEFMCLIACFVKKHQTLATVINMHVAPKCVLVLGTVHFATVLFIWCVTLTLAGMDRDTQMDHVKLKYPEYTYEFSQLPNFAIYELNTFSKIDLIIAFLGDAFGVSVFFVTTFDMFRILKQVQTKVSTSSFKCYQSAVYSLLAQFVTSILCIAPPLSFVFMMMIGMKDNSGYSVQAIGALYSLHSTVNAIVLVITTPPFRKLICGFKNKTKPLIANAISSNASKGF